MTCRRRLRIGILVGGIADDYSTQLCLGVMHAAADKDINIFVFPGKYIDRNVDEGDDIKYEYQYNTLFSYPNSANLDGLIIAAGSIGCFTSADRIDDFLERFDSIPGIMVATKDPKRCCICYDNQNAVKEGIRTLINDCGCKRLCIVSGPAGNTDAAEREQAFFETLEESGLDYSGKNRQEGDLASSEKTAKAVEMLLHDNPDMDGLFCINDEMAKMAYEVLAAHGRAVGKDVFVMGYDNVINSTKMDPPLSTVAADPFSLGEITLSALLKKISGEHVESITIPARLIVRESFGKVDKALAKEVDVRDSEIRDYFKLAFYRYINDHDSHSVEQVYKIFKGIMLTILDFKDDPKVSEKKVGLIADEFEKLFHMEAMPYIDVDMMARYIGHVYRTAALVIQNDPEYKAMLLDSVLQTFHSLVIRENSMIGEFVKEHKNKDVLRKRFISKTMDFKHGTDQSYQVFLDCFDWLDVRNACIYVLDHPSYHLENERYKPASVYYKKAVLKDGIVKVLPISEQPVSIDAIFDVMDFSDKQRNMVLVPLFFAEELYGFVMLDLNEKIFGEAECIASQLGASSHILMTLKENEKIRQELEDSLSLMKQMNIRLDELSKMDQLTGLYNRRGFVEEGEKHLLKANTSGEKCIVGYADMNNLKIVNDRFGHEEGDFSLKIIADALKSVLGEDSVIGRIGGDEYAFVTSEAVIDSGDELGMRVNRLLSDFNRTSNKPYNISVSVGVTRTSGKVNCTLEEALSNADKMLYERKRDKDKNIIKNSRLI